MADNETGEKGRKAKLLTTARKRFDYCLEVEAKTRESQRDDKRFYAGSPDNGWQWPDKVKHGRETDPNGSRPCLTINKLPQHVHQITNEQRQNRPQIKVLPVDDKADPDVAEKLNGIIRHIENISDADVAYDTACENQVIHGEGFWRVLTDYVDDNSFDQDIFIKRIRNSFNVHLDPDIQAPAGDDAKFGFIDELLTEAEFDFQYPDADPIDWTGITADVSNWYKVAEKKVRIAEYFYIEREAKTIYFLANGRVVEKLQAGEKAVKERKAELKKVKWCKLAGNQILEERDWAGKYIPIVRIPGNEIDVDGELVVSGLVRNAKDPQRMYNYHASLEVEVLGLAPKSPIIGAAGQFDGFEDKWKTANTTNWSYLEYNAIVDEVGNTLGPPQRQPFPMPPQGIIQAKMAAAEDIKNTTSQYNASLGQQGNETSGIAIQRRNKESDTANFHYNDNLSRGLKYTGRIIIDLIPKTYDVPRIARMLGLDGVPDLVALDPTIPTATQPKIDPVSMKEIGMLYNPSIGKYDVAVSTGPGYTTQRQEAAKMMVDLSQGVSDPHIALVMRYLAVKNMDWSGAQDLAAVLRKMLPPGIDPDKDEKGPDPAQVQQQMQQVQQAGQQLQQHAQVLKQKEQELQQLQQKLANEQTSTDAQKQVLQAQARAVQTEIKALHIEQHAQRADAENGHLKRHIEAFKAETERLKALVPLITPQEAAPVTSRTISDSAAQTV